MANPNSEAYVLGSTIPSENAEASNYNRLAGQIEMRKLIELMVISRILREGFGISEDLPTLRADVAKAIT